MPDPTEHLRRYADDIASAVSPARSRVAAMAAIGRVEELAPVRRRRPLAWRVQVAGAAMGAFFVLNFAVAAVADNAVPGDRLYFLDRAYERIGGLFGDVDHEAERATEAQVLLERGDAAGALQLLAESSQVTEVREAATMILAAGLDPAVLQGYASNLVAEVEVLASADDERRMNEALAAVRLVATQVEASKPGTDTGRPAHADETGRPDHAGGPGSPADTPGRPDETSSPSPGGSPDRPGHSDQTGPPDHAGQTGPPDHAADPGRSGSSGQGKGSSGNTGQGSSAPPGSSGSGPPDHASETGPPDHAGQQGPPAPGGSGGTGGESTPPAQSGSDPEQGDPTPPGRGGTNPGQGNANPPNQDKTPPGQGESNPGKGNTSPPGQDKPPPGQGGSNPGRGNSTPPGHGGSNPGKGNSTP